jgi:hypothetical protein
MIYFRNIKIFENFNLKYELIDSLISRLESGKVNIKKNYPIYLEIERVAEGGFIQVLSDIVLNSSNIDEFRINTGLRGLLLCELVRKGVDVKIKYNSILKPGENSFDYPLLSYFTTEELEFIDYSFFGKKLYNMDKESFIVFKKGLDFNLEFCKNLIESSNRLSKNLLSNMKSIDDYINEVDIVADNNYLFRGTAIDDLYGYVNLKTNINRSRLDKRLSISILKSLS